MVAVFEVASDALGFLQPYGEPFYLSLQTAYPSIVNMEIGLPFALWCGFALLFGFVIGARRRRHLDLKEFSKQRAAHEEATRRAAAARKQEICALQSQVEDAVVKPAPPPAKPAASRQPQGVVSPVFPAKKAGYLKKKSSKALLGWQQRWFVAEAHFLKYSRSKATGRRRVEIDLTEVAIEAGKKSTILDIRFQGKVYSLKAATADDAGAWRRDLEARQQQAKAAAEPEAASEPPPAYEDALSDTAAIAALAKDLRCSSHEATVLKQLQAMREARCPGVAVDPGSALRFLRARNLDVGAAEPLLQRHMDWRKCVLPLEVADVEAELNLGRYTWLGRDRQGQPCLLVDESRLGKHTYKDFNKVMDAVVFGLEAVLKHTSPLGRISVIYSRVNAGQGTVDLNYLQALAICLCDNYPERLHRLFVTPCDAFARGFFKTFSVFLDPVTLAKIELLPDHTDPRLLDAIPPETVPTFLGGANTRHQDGFKMEDLVNPQAAGLL